MALWWNISVVWLATATSKKHTWTHCHSSAQAQRMVSVTAETGETLAFQWKKSKASYKSTQNVNIPLKY